MEPTIAKVANEIAAILFKTITNGIGNTDKNNPIAPEMVPRTSGGTLCCKSVDRRIENMVAAKAFVNNNPNDQSDNIDELSRLFQIFH